MTHKPETLIAAAIRSLPEAVAISMFLIMLFHVVVIFDTAKKEGWGQFTPSQSLVHQ